MENTVEIDIKELFLVLLRNIGWIILAMLVGACAAFGITRIVLIPQYTSSVSMYVNNNSQDDNTTAAALNLNDINASQKLVNTYIVILQDDEVLEQIAEQLMKEYTQRSLEAFLPYVDTENGRVLSTAAIRESIRLTAVNNTEILRVEVETANPKLSAYICTLMTEIAPEVLTRVVKAGSVEVIGEPKVSNTPSSPNLPINCAIGALVGFVISVALILLITLLDNTIKDEEDFRKHYDLPVLGEIPDFAVENKGGGRSGKKNGNIKPEIQKRAQ